jgi:hypothetical protein
MDKIRNSAYELNTKKSIAAFLLNVVDHFPLLRKDEQFMQSESMRDLRIYNGVLKEKSIAITKARGENIYYPLTEEVKRRIHEKLQGMAKLLSLI